MRTEYIWMELGHLTCWKAVKGSFMMEEKPRNVIHYMLVGLPVVYRYIYDGP